MRSTSVNFNFGFSLIKRKTEKTVFLFTLFQPCDLQTSFSSVVAVFPFFKLIIQIFIIVLMQNWCCIVVVSFTCLLIKMMMEFKTASAESYLQLIELIVWESFGLIGRWVYIRICVLNQKEMGLILSSVLNGLRLWTYFIFATTPSISSKLTVNIGGRLGGINSYFAKKNFCSLLSNVLYFWFV